MKKDLLLKSGGIEAKILFVRNEQKDCSEWPEQMFNKETMLTAKKKKEYKKRMPTF